MSAKSQMWFARIVLISVALGSTTISASSAVSVEVAKKCAALAAETYPPREIGNPAAGFLNGSARDKLDYYQRCVASGGNMDEKSAGQTK